MSYLLDPRHNEATLSAASDSPPLRRVLVLVETVEIYGRNVIRGISQYAKDTKNWQLHFELLGVDSVSPERLEKWQGDGIIALTTSRDQAEKLWATGLSVVTLRGDPEQGLADVDCDDVGMGRMAVEHFLERGFRHFGYFAPSSVWWIKAHCHGFCDALKAHNFNCHNYPAPPSSDPVKMIWQENRRPQIAKWLESLPRPIGIYAAGDLASVRLLEVCQENRIAVPEEIAILGVVNDVMLCESTRPTLSSIELDTRRVGYEAARLLERRMDGKEPSKEVVHVPPSRVVVRQSTDLMLLEDADVVRALKYIRENACRGIDVDRVANAVGLSRSVLQRRFLQHLKRPPKTEIMRVRIEQAKTLLMRSEKISEGLARQCGFSSLRYFTLAFCREVGMTPAAYRRVQQNAPDS